MSLALTIACGRQGDESIRMIARTARLVELSLDVVSLFDCLSIPLGEVHYILGL